MGRLDAVPYPVFPVFLAYRIPVSRSRFLKFDFSTALVERFPTKLIINHFRPFSFNPLSFICKDGGIRYAKGCLPDSSMCEGAMALQACKELIGEAAKSTTCTTCNTTDLCNKEEDQQDYSPTTTSPGSGGTKLVGTGVGTVLLVVVAIGNVAAAFLG